MAHKLVKLDNDRIITGDELKVILMAEIFTIPVKVALIQQPYPTKPVSPGSGATSDQWKQYIAYNNVYQVERARITYENNLARTEYFKQFTDFAQVLRDKFAIVKGTYNYSTRSYDYSTTTPVTYTYEQCAAKLMGQYGTAPLNGVDFICYNYF